MNEIRDIYRQSYRYLQNNPYTKLRKEEKIVPFAKVTSFNPCTVQYIATHTDELDAVNYNTGVPTPTELIYYYVDKIKKSI